MARREAWGLTKGCTPHELLERVATLRYGEGLWDLIKNDDRSVSEVDREICNLESCRWIHWKPPSGYEPYMEHSLREVVRRASLEVPGVKPARIRHLLAREAKAGRLKRVARGRYIHPPREWSWLEPEERYEHDAQDARWQARAERSFNQRGDVLLVHYLIQWPAYRKSKALSISERAYYYHLGGALEYLDAVLSPRRTVQC
jgi:hypothetical protein